MNPDNNFGSNLKKVRKENKFTQFELAKEIGISRTYLSDLENNRYSPSLKTAQSLADKLNVSICYLITGE
jgi:transcriptional regulator with XRE-family HTH domain